MYKMYNQFSRVILHFTLFCIGVSPVFAANTCEVIGSPERFFLVEIDGKNFNAMSQTVFAELKQRSQADAATIEKLKNQVAQYRETLGEYQQLTERYEKLRQDQATLADEYNVLLADSVELNHAFEDRAQSLLQLTTNYEKLANDYDQLAGKYRKIAVDTTSLFKLDLGAGVTSNNGDAEAAMLIGVGFRKVKTWGFLQRDNSGLLIGTSYRF